MVCKILATVTMRKRLIATNCDGSVSMYKKDVARYGMMFSRSFRWALKTNVIQLMLMLHKVAKNSGLPFTFWLQKCKVPHSILGSEARHHS
jgi:hypothetical protein